MKQEGDVGVGGNEGIDAAKGWLGIHVELEERNEEEAEDEVPMNALPETPSVGMSQQGRAQDTPKGSHAMPSDAWLSPLSSTTEGDVDILLGTVGVSFKRTFSFLVKRFMPSFSPGAASLFPSHSFSFWGVPRRESALHLEDTNENIDNDDDDKA